MAFLQRPGGNGPQQKLTPLGGLAQAITPLPTPPAEYHSSNTAATGLSRIDNVNRLISQYEVNTGKYNRAAVAPTFYERGNIVPSQEPVGVAGYNQAGKMMTPMKAADLSQAQYLNAEAANMNPLLRAEMQAVTAVPQQNFFNPQDPANYPLVNYNMPDNLPMQGSMNQEGNDE